MLHSRAARLAQLAFVTLLLIVVVSLLGSSPLVPLVSATGHKAARPVSGHFVATPTASGAANAYPLNETFDADPQPVGTPPANSSFESPVQNVGTPPTNSDFSAAPTVAGTPETSYNFAAGNFSGWSITGAPIISTDPTHGNYAKLSTSTGDAVTSSPFTVDPSTQALSLDVDYITLGNYSGVHVYILTGAGYGTRRCSKTRPASTAATGERKASTYRPAGTSRSS